MSRLTPARLRPLLVKAGRQHHRSVEGDVNIFKTLAALGFPEPSVQITITRGEVHIIGERGQRCPGGNRSTRITLISAHSTTKVAVT
jgi:hypothetical protein